MVAKNLLLNSRNVGSGTRWHALNCRAPPREEIARNGARDVRALISRYTRTHLPDLMCVAGDKTMPSRYVFGMR